MSDRIVAKPYAKRLEAYSPRINGFAFADGEKIKEEKSRYCFSRVAILAPQQYNRYLQLYRFVNDYRISGRKAVLIAIQLKNV